MSEWREQTLSNPAENEPCSEKLEKFVKDIAWQLKSGHGDECSQEEIIRRVCNKFNLKPPITGGKIRTFLEESGIYHEVSGNAGDTTFFYNRLMSRWEIHTRPCATYEWSREVWHDVWEILFWRCFHVIPWWKEWAAQKGYLRPHDKADEFAFLLLLSSLSVPAQARKRLYDVYGVADYYTVPTSLAFRALQSYTRFSHPLLMAVLRLDVRPPEPKQSSIGGGLFEEYNAPATSVYAQVYHKVNKPGYERPGYDAVLDPRWQQEHRDLQQSFKTLSHHLRQKSIVCVSPDDPMYRYCRQAEPRAWVVQHLFGVDLPKEVCVITRQSPRCSNEIFLQVIPCEYEDAFMPDDNDLRNLPEVAQHMMEAEWRQAAQRIKKNGGLTSLR